MVSFSCEACGDVLTKKKLNQHTYRCRTAAFTCIDCLTTFVGSSYHSHISCVSEAQKYQGSYFEAQKNHYQNTPVQLTGRQPASSQSSHTLGAKTESSRGSAVDMAPKPYVEDILDSDQDHGCESPVVMPEAPTPPSPVAHETLVNVFDFLVASETPNSSTANFGAGSEAQLVRFDQDHFMYDHDDAEPLVQYGTGPVPTRLDPVTPLPVKPSRKKSKEGHLKDKDKKRKRLHVEITDQVMVDAPPILHSGLTGGLSRLMRSTLPPSPDLSSGDVDTRPQSPTRKNRHSKTRTTRSEGGLGTNLLALVSGRSKSSKKRTERAERTEPKKTSQSHGDIARKTRSGQEDRLDLVEHKDSKRSERQQPSQQIILYNAPADLFFNMVNKGPESDRGCSIHKVLRRFHRERSASGEGSSKSSDEKDLWRSLRLRRNDRGEIVLFSLPEKEA